MARQLTMPTLLLWARDDWIVSFNKSQARASRVHALHARCQHVRPVPACAHPYGVPSHARRGTHKTGAIAQVYRDHVKNLQFHPVQEGGHRVTPAYASVIPTWLSAQGMAGAEMRDLSEV